MWPDEGREVSGLDGESTPDTEQNIVSGHRRKRTGFFFFFFRTQGIWCGQSMGMLEGMRPVR